MDSRKMAKLDAYELRRTWEERIQKQKVSSLSILAGAKKIKLLLIYSTTGKGRFPPKTLSQDCFIEITGTNDMGITIECGGVHIRLDKHFDVATLKRCLQVLKTC